MACLVRVPTEVIKQRLQTGRYENYQEAFKKIYQTEGVFRGFYRGFFTTVLREIPFTCIQFPLYEHMKSRYDNAWICGSISGGIAAFLTTPLDVVKTRIMLGSGQAVGFGSTFAEVVRKEGVRGCFHGAIPRVTWMSLGGAIFLGTYDFIANIL